MIENWPVRSRRVPILEMVIAGYFEVCRLNALKQIRIKCEETPIKKSRTVATELSAQKYVAQKRCGVSENIRMRDK